MIRTTNTMWLLFIVVIAYTQPTISKEKIPANLDPEVRMQIENLLAEDPAIRGNAVIELGKMRSADAVPFLIEMFRDMESFEFRREFMTVYIISPAELSIEALANTGTVALPQLIHALRNNEDHNVRNGAAKALGLIGHADAFPALAAALRDEDFGVATTAATAIAELHDPRSLDALLDAMPYFSKMNWGGIAGAIVLLGDERAIDPLIAELKAGDKITATEALGGLKATKAIDLIVDLLNDTNMHCRSVAATALGDIGGESVVKPLIDLLKDEPDESVRASVKFSLIKITGKEFGDDYSKWKNWFDQNKNRLPEELSNHSVDKQLVNLLSTDPAIRANAVSALVEMRSAEAVPFLIKMFYNRELSYLAVETLAGMGTIAVPQLVKALQNSPEAAIRSNAATTLGLIGHKDAFPALTAALKDEDYNVAFQAAVSIARLHDPRSFDTLVEALTYFRKKQWKGIPYALQILGDERAIAPLITEIQMKGDRLGAIRALSTTAPEILNEIENESGVELLIGLINDGDEEVRQEALNSLYKITDQSFEKDYEWRMWLKWKNRLAQRKKNMTTYPDPAIKIHIENLYSGDADTRANAVIALGETHSLIAIPFLIDMFLDYGSVYLEQEHSSSFTNFTSPSELAVESLAKMNTSAMPQLIQALQHDPEEMIRINAARTLGRIKHPDVFPVLAEALKDENIYVAAGAAEGIATLHDSRSLDTLLLVLENFRKNNMLPILYQALQILGNERAADALIAELSMENKVEAVYSLGQIKAKKAVKPLIDLLDNENSQLRSSVAMALGEIGDELAVKPLIDLLRDEEELVRANAVYSLERITGKSFGGDYSKWNGWFAQVRKSEKK